jgi:hypothetical protein
VLGSGCSGVKSLLGLATPLGSFEAVCLLASLQIATLVYTSYTAKTNASLNNISLFFLQLNPTDTSPAFPCVPWPVSGSVSLHLESKGPNRRFHPTHLLACYCYSA